MIPSNFHKALIIFILFFELIVDLFLSCVYFFFIANATAAMNSDVRLTLIEFYFVSNLISFTALHMWFIRMSWNTTTLMHFCNSNRAKKKINKSLISSYNNMWERERENKPDNRIKFKGRMHGNSIGSSILYWLFRIQCYACFSQGSGKIKCQPEPC